MGVGHQLFVLPSMLGSLLMRDFVALHMTWGAINELTTLTGYYQLIRRSHHPVLHQMLRKVIQDERRHFAFYRAQAKARLTRNPRAGRMVRWALKSFWTPVGAGVKTDEEVDALALYLFADAPEGRQAVRDVDGMVSELPGLQGLTLLEDVLDRAIERARRKPGGRGWGPGSSTAPSTAARGPMAGPPLPRPRTGAPRTPRGRTRWRPNRASRRKIRLSLPGSSGRARASPYATAPWRTRCECHPT